jgi:hypothetical protein
VFGYEYGIRALSGLVHPACCGGRWCSRLHYICATSLGLSSDGYEVEFLCDIEELLL